MNRQPQPLPPRALSMATTGVYPLLLPLKWPGTPSCHAKLRALKAMISVWQGSCAAGLRAAYPAVRYLKRPVSRRSFGWCPARTAAAAGPAATEKRAYRLKVAASSERFFCPQLGRPPPRCGLSKWRPRRAQLTHAAFTLRLTAALCAPAPRHPTPGAYRPTTATGLAAQP